MTEYITIPKGGRPVRQIPKELSELSTTLTIKELAAHFKVSEPTIYRWLAKQGIRNYVKAKSK